MLEATLDGPVPRIEHDTKERQHLPNYPVIRMREKGYDLEREGGRERERERERGRERERERITYSSYVLMQSVYTQLKSCYSNLGSYA